MGFKAPLFQLPQCSSAQSAWFWLHPSATAECEPVAVCTAWMGISEAATRRGFAALSARGADVLAGSQPKLMLLPHPKCSCCWGAPACSKKGTFGSSGNSESLLICWTEEFRHLYDSFHLQKFCLRSVSRGMQRVTGV